MPISKLHTRFSGLGWNRKTVSMAIKCHGAFHSHRWTTWGVCLIKLTHKLIKWPDTLSRTDWQTGHVFSVLIGALKATADRRCKLYNGIWFESYMTRTWGCGNRRFTKLTFSLKIKQHAGRVCTRKASMWESWVARIRGLYEKYAICNNYENPPNSQQGRYVPTMVSITSFRLLHWLN